jgi:multidrug transporter EmrE-like cation transporter
MTRSWAWGLVAATVCVNTSAQVAMKFAALHLVAGNTAERWAFNPWIWAAAILSGAAIVCWLGALKTLPLATAYPWTALVYVLTPTMSVIVFKDAPTYRYFVGIISICVGIFFTTRGVRPASD